MTVFDLPEIQRESVREGVRENVQEVELLNPNLICPDL